MDKQPTIYYAHCIKDYGSNMARAHIAHLRKLGFHVIDPSDSEFEQKVQKMKREGKNGSQIMDWFVLIVEECDHLAFSTTDDGKVSAGVWKEIQTMKKKGGTIIQMPSLNDLKVMSIEETKEYIKSF